MRSMRHCGGHRLSLVVGVGVESLGLGEMYMKVVEGIDGGVGVDLFGPEEREENIEEVGQAEGLTVSAKVVVECLRV